MSTTYIQLNSADPSVLEHSTTGDFTVKLGCGFDEAKAWSLRAGKRSSCLQPTTRVSRSGAQQCTQDGVPIDSHLHGRQADYECVCRCWGGDYPGGLIAVAWLAQRRCSYWRQSHAHRGITGGANSLFLTRRLCRLDYSGFLLESALEKDRGQT